MEKQSFVREKCVHALQSSGFRTNKPEFKYECIHHPNNIACSHLTSLEIRWAIRLPSYAAAMHPHLFRLKQAGVRGHERKSE